MEYRLQKGSVTAVCESHGGELVSLKDQSGHEYIWQGDSRYWGGRNPNLFPAINAMKDGAVRFDGVPYPLQRHGFARHAEFSVFDKGDDFIVFELRESEETLKQYPFPFIFRIHHRLTDNGFTTSYEVINPGEKTLPYTVGGHTAFNTEGEFSDWRIIFEKAENAWARIPLKNGLVSDENREYVLKNTDTLPLTHEDYDRVDTFMFDGLSSQSVKLLGPDGKGVQMDFADFPMIAFWTAVGKNAPYICMEPWHGCGAFENESGEFADKHHAILLPAGETKVLTYKVTIL